MADVKWIKLDTDMFSNPKIKKIRRLPEGNNILLIWVMLLTMAGKCNAGGMIHITENILYTTEDLAEELGFSIETVKLALEALEKMGMLLTQEGLAIANWEFHQNEAALSTIREAERIRKQEYREKKRSLLEDKNVSRTCPGQVQGLSYSYSNSISISNSNSNSLSDNKEDSNSNSNSNTNSNTNKNDNDNERIVDESSKKRKKTSKDLQFEILDKLLPAKSISIPLAEKIYEWIEYKTEKGNSYKERGLMVLLSQIEAKEQEYGSTALIDLIDTCMARNYQGIIFDILENKKTVKETGRTTNSNSNRNSNKGMLDSLLADIKKAEESGTENIVEERKGIF